jgi:hypothetical protein
MPEAPVTTISLPETASKSILDASDSDSSELNTEFLIMTSNLP